MYFAKTFFTKKIELLKLSDEIIDALSIDCVVFGFKDSSLSVLLVKHGDGITKGKWALPGGWIKYNESLDKAAYRILTSQTAVQNIYLEQFHVFGEVNRFPVKRVINVCYYALVNIENFALHAGPTVTDVVWVNVDKVPKMNFGDNKIFTQ